MTKATAIRAYQDTYRGAFAAMLGECLRTDYQIPLTERDLAELCGEITASVHNSITFLDLLLVENEAKGFVIYQIDTPESDWCEKESWGCIREFYISAPLRRKGYGRALAAHAEERLWELPVPGIYLTTDDAADFWLKLGYRDSGEVCAANGGRVFVKTAPGAAL